MEHLRSNEQQPKQANPELENLASEQLKKAGEKNEQESRPNESIETAREKLRHVEVTAPQTEAEVKHEAPGKLRLSPSANYRQTMVTLRHRLSPASRRFSSVIHTPVIEKTSEVLAKTIARPSVSLGAITGAVIMSGGFYLFARHYGFTLKGSEVWVGLLIGAAIGLLSESLWRFQRKLKARRQHKR